VTSKIEYQTAKGSYFDLLSTTYAHDPEAILLVGYQIEASQIIKDYNNDFITKETFWFFTDAIGDVSNAEFVTAVGGDHFTFMHEGVRVALPSGPRYDAFNRAFIDKYKMPGIGYGPNYFDAIYLLALAMTAAGRTDGPSIEAVLRTVANPPGDVYNWMDYRGAVKALHAGTKINYEGVSGPVDFDANGDVIAPYDIWRIQNGVQTIIVSGIMP
jgi:ABC-type branched-subunit amino acid transport system substrate-binding protein